MGSKFKLAREYLVNQLGMDIDRVAGLGNEEVMQTLAQSLHDGAGGTLKEATQLLWDLHHPYMVWVYLGLIGLAGTLGMILFYFAAIRTRTPAAQEPPAA
jgi:hypothetical protein